MNPTGTDALRRVAISGSWRHTPAELVADVERDVAELVAAGAMIVTGGALGVDLIAAATALSVDPSGGSLTVILPTPFDVYAGHYRRRAAEGVISVSQAEQLIDLLDLVDGLSGLVTLDHSAVDQTTYYARNTAVLAESTELFAYQVNASAGTQDTIDKARASGMPVTLRTYTI